MVNESWWANHHNSYIDFTIENELQDDGHSIFVLYGYHYAKSNGIGYIIADAETEEELRIWAELNGYDIQHVNVTRMA